MEIVIFKLRDINYAIPTEKVLEVVESVCVTQIPFVPPLILNDLRYDGVL